MMLSLTPLAAVSFWEKIAEWYRGSVLRELLDYFLNRYFTVELGAYDNFSLSATMGSTVRNLLLAVMMGFIFACIYTSYTRTVYGGFVRRLIKEESNSPERARSLFELGYFRNPAVRRELSKGTMLRMVVRCREAEEAALEEAVDGKKAHTPFKIDFTNAHFYVPEELRHRAEIRFEKKGSGIVPLVLTLVCVVVAASLLCWLLPDALQFADNLITFFSPS